MRKALLAIIAALFLVAPAMAQQTSQEAAEKTCDAVVQTYRQKGLTVGLQDYAECVQREKKSAAQEACPKDEACVAARDAATKAARAAADRPRFDPNRPRTAADIFNASKALRDADAALAAYRVAIDDALAKRDAAILAKRAATVPKPTAAK